MDANLDPSGAMFTEQLLSTAPILIRRRVQWGECDPAGVVYTPRFAEYSASAFQWFIREVFRPALADASVSTPVKALKLEFHRTLTPEEMFDMRVLVTDVRTRTFDLQISGTGLDGSRRFTSLLTAITVNPVSFTSVSIPLTSRAAIVHYKENYQ